WWGMSSGNCRSGSLDGNGDFTSGPFACFDYWQGGAVEEVQMFPEPGSGAQIRGVVALPAGDGRIRAVPEDAAVYSFKVLINNARTAGLGACKGCDVEACIVLTSVQVDQPPPLPTFIITWPTWASHALWQGWHST